MQKVSIILGGVERDSLAKLCIFVAANTSAVFPFAAIVGPVPVREWRLKALGWVGGWVGGGYQWND